MAGLHAAILEMGAIGLPFATSGATPSAGAAIFQSILPFLIILPLFYILLIRPQQTRAKQHREMVENIRRGDTIVTTGGLIGKVTKVGENELTIELADGVRARLVRGMVADVRGKGQLVPANDSKPS